MSPSEVVRQPSSCVGAADPAVSFLGLAAELGFEAADESVFWAMALPDVNSPVMHSRKPQAALRVSLL